MIQVPIILFEPWIISCVTRRCHIIQQSFLITRLCVLYPYYCLMYMLAPHTTTGLMGY